MMNESFATMPSKDEKVLKDWFPTKEDLSKVHHQVGSIHHLKRRDEKLMPFVSTGVLWQSFISTGVSRKYLPGANVMLLKMFWTKKLGILARIAAIWAEKCW
jgi:hypothetical protein